MLLFFFPKKLQFIYPPDLHEGRASYRRSPQSPQKANIHHFIFLGIVFALLDPDPADPKPMRIRIHNTGSLQLKVLSCLHKLTWV
jgi:hypothetical protein